VTGVSATGNTGSVSISTSDSAAGLAGGITLSVGASASGQGGSLSLTGGKSTAGSGGSVVLNAGTGISGGTIKMQSASGAEYVSVSDNKVDINVGQNGQISMTIPLPTGADVNSLSAGNSMIGFGFTSVSNTNYNFRLQSITTSSGSP
jgi:hypothetical protein